MTQTHWQAWHEPYDVPGSYLQRRLAIVQQRLSSILDEARLGPISIVSMCAGEGRDVIGVLEQHPRRSGVRARLVELDPGNAAKARVAVQSAGMEAIEVVEADAARLAVYDGAVPADVVMACGVFGNISDQDIERTIATLPQLCAADAAVIWTRHRRDPDLTPTIRGWFAEHGFDERSFDAPDDAFFSVGVARFRGQPVALDPSVTMFRFVVGT